MPSPYLQPTAEELKAGDAAASRIRIYEKYVQPHEWQRPWVLLGALVFFVAGAVLIEFKHGDLDHVWPFMLPVLFSGAWCGSFTKAQRDRDKALLRELHDMYGDDLPWLEEEKQLAAARALEEAIQRTQAKA